MHSGNIALSTILAVMLLTTCVIIIPGSEADDTAEYEYGSTYDFNSDQIDDLIKAGTGHSVEEWIQYLSDQSDRYDFSLDKFDAISKIAVTRNTCLDGNDYTIDDHVTGYVKTHMDARGDGHFPAPGTYEAKENETIGLFLKRIFIDEGLTTTRNTEYHFDIQLFVDIDCISHIDIATGYMTDASIRFKVAMYDMEDRNIDFHLETDDNYNPVSATIDYKHTKCDNNFFLDVKVDLTMEGMRVFTDDTEPWTIKPLITEHVDKFVISSDLADSLWLQLAAQSEKDIIDSKLPKLILDLIGSGGRMLDLFDTIKSLTSSDIPDASMTGRFRAENTTDAHGYKYCQLTLLKDDGTEGTVFKLPKAGYTLNLCDLVNMIPDYVIDSSRKGDICAVIHAFGYDDIEIKDITNDIGKKDECSILQAYVNEKITEDDTESYTVPTEYVISATVILLVSCILISLMWRRMI